MRTNEDMLRAVHQRADRMRRDGQKRRRLWMGGGAAAFVGYALPLLTGAATILARRRFIPRDA